ncbi:benzoate 1,2-dioxygenase electron transfer component BenC [Corynebacterium sp. HMSC11E11]|uniref:benzoate 1,2-dioxygenase electron transfer component BenC n=1 Tax=Corynebacterium sp. HMSC11E11 TaxID=1581089 RepID=UPI0008A1F45F|nr:benzoate 1,2-dioxygenase electron transfer component BenC [Corynebacterium sp. HMSC11E11]OFU57062.1 benzene 1,2-dioxygenase [Corynebacterium sp. HMSC11E11]
MTHQIALAFEDGITRFIECDEDQTVADAAYKARINIPFDCRDGACGTCKAFCEAGDYEDGEYIEDALSDAEAAEGYCLPCQMTPLTDLVLQVATTSEQAKTGASTVTGTITEITRHSDSTVGFSVELEDRSQLAYLPGQYMNITVPGTDQTRSYSFSSGPSEDTVSFLVKLTRGGLMTGYLEERAKVGDKLAMTGPMGSFFLREPLAPILLLAGGTGLAPVLSILEKLTEDELLDVPVRLVYGATFDMDLVKLDVLDSFRDRLPDFDYFTVVSDPETDHERKGYVTDHMTDEHLHDGEADVYLCGPPPMVEAVRVFLSERPNPPANFYYEKFSSAAGPAGAGSAEVEVTSSSSGEGDSARDEISVASPGVVTGEVHSAKADSTSQFEARMALELGALELSLHRLKKIDLEEYRRLAVAVNEHIDGEKIIDSEAFTAANNEFHEFLFTRTGNPALLAAYRNLAIVEVMNRALADATWIQGDIAAEHLAIVDAVAAGDKERAAELIRSHNSHAITTMHRAIEDEEVPA